MEYSPNLCDVANYLHLFFNNKEAYFSIKFQILKIYDEIVSVRRLPGWTIMTSSGHMTMGFLRAISLIIAQQFFMVLSRLTGF